MVGAYADRTMQRSRSRTPRVAASPALGLGAVSLAAALWAIGGSVAATLFRRGVPPVELAEARAVVAGIGLALWPSVWSRSTRGGAPGHLVALGVCIALINAAYYIAIDHLPVAVAIVLQYTAPAMVVGWTAVVARRRPDRRITAALCAALAGVVLVSGVLAGDLSSIDVVGVLAGLASGVLFASYTLLGERVGAAYGTAPGLARAFVVATAVWVCIQAFRGWPGVLFEARNLPGVLYVGIGATLAPFLLYVWGLGLVRAERAAIAATLEPVLGALVAWVWLGQSLTLVQVAGGLAVIGAVLLIQVHRPRVVLAPEV